MGITSEVLYQLSYSGGRAILGQLVERFRPRRTAATHRMARRCCGSPPKTPRRYRIPQPWRRIPTLQWV